MAPQRQGRSAGMEATAQREGGAAGRQTRILRVDGIERTLFFNGNIVYIRESDRNRVGPFVPLRRGRRHRRRRPAEP